DSDRDSVPDDVDTAPLDFNNDGTPDAQSRVNNMADVDADGTADYPYGSDWWLNTTIPSNFPAPYAGRPVSIFVGPIVKPEVLGEDVARIYLDTDADPGTGYRVGDMGADRMLEFRGKHGSVTAATYNQFSGLNPGAWTWTVMTAPNYMMDSTELEAYVAATLHPNATAFFEVEAWDKRCDDADLGGIPTELAGTRAAPQEPETLGAPQDPLYEVTSGNGSAAGDRFGWNVSWAGDVNGDTYDDVIVGAPYNDNGASDGGAVYIFFGYSGFRSASGKYMNPVNANVTINGTVVGGHFGWDVSDAGNINGDSYGDVIIGEPGNVNGKAYIFNGRATWNKWYTSSDRNTEITGEASGDRFGASVSGAGKYNSTSSNDDVIVGAPNYGTNDEGRAYVFYGDGSIPTTAGTADVILKGKNANGKFGSSVSTAGNVDATGGSEVIVGDPGKNRSHVFYKPDDKIASTDWPVSGTVTNSYTNTQTSNDAPYEILEEEAGAGGNTDTLITYGRYGVASLYYSVWGGSAWGTDTADGNFVATPEWVVAKSNPTRNEIVAGAICGDNTAPSDAWVNVWNGVSDTWGTPLQLTSAIPYVPAYRQYDIAFESTSGDAIIFYADGTAATLYYRIWNGASWGSQQTYTMTTITGNIYWIDASSDPASDEIAVMVTDSNSDIAGVIWDGASLSNELLLETTVTTTGFPCHDVEHEQQSGEAMFVWGAGTNMESRQWTGSAWNAEITAVAIGGSPVSLSLQADPLSNKLVVASTDSGDYLNTARWDGTGPTWTLDAEHDAAIEGGSATGQARKVADAIFETASGHEGHIILVYGDSNADIPDYRHFDGTSWSAINPIDGTARATDNLIVQLRRDANGLIFLGVVDDEWDLNTWTWNSASGTWTWQKEHHIDCSMYTDPTECFMIAPSCPLPSLSKLEHKWNITITASYENTFYLEANRTSGGSTDNDNFTFYYTIDSATATGVTVGGTGWTEMLTVTATSDPNSYQTYTDSTLTNYDGKVFIGVIDTDRAGGNNSKDVLCIDHMFIRRIPEATLFGPSGSKCGWSVANAGNVNAGGGGDVIIGAPGTTNGNAYVWFDGDFEGQSSITNDTQAHFTSPGSTLGTSNPNKNIFATAGGDLNLSANYVLDDDFDSMTVGNTPTGWTVDESGGSVRVSDEQSVSPSNSVKIVDTSAAASSYMDITFTGIVKGVIEWDAYITVGAEFRMDGFSSGTQSIVTFFTATDIRYHDGVNHIVQSSYNLNQWYHLKIVFDNDADTFDFYIDDSLKEADCGYF
ncbi:MAG: integrin alpha, partial [Candidatus Thermoplasmatota archaeon]|nr:integrin alpha [Candidatus Thermoplasmatota archaeon]